jgi:glycosyltransferase involved in cell wall biosynthesis
VITRLNAGGPAHHVGVLSSGLGPAYETLLVHGRVGAGEAPLEDFDARYPTRRLELPDLGPEVRPVRDLLTLLRLVRILRRMRPDVVHTHTAKAGLVGRLAALSLRPRPAIVHTYHGHVLEGYFGRSETSLYRLAERALGRVSDRLVGVSDATVADLRRFGIGTAATLRVIRLGLDLDEFLRAGPPEGAGFRAETGVRPGETLVVTVGRLVPIKRCDVALRAVAHACAGGAPLRLAVVGDGPLRAELEDLAHRLGIAGRVVFTGYRGDLPAIAAAADVALLSSDNEGTPVWLIEAAAAATPAVATDVGGVREVVADGTGVTAPARDHAALGDALGALAADADRRGEMGSAARRHVRERYAAERLLGDVDRLYTELVCTAAAPRTTRA